MKALFWILISFILYSYFGYALLLMLIKIIRNKKANATEVKNISGLPNVTVMIAAYNEEKVIPEKVENLHRLDYPKEKLHFVWITDGSDDSSPALLSAYPDMQVMHESIRAGKIGAINRG